MYYLLGAYVPLTMEGNIVVNEVLASCYPSTHHDLAHFAMTPFRYFPQLIMSIFHDENGFSGFVKIMEDFGKWAIPNCQLF